MKPLFRRLLGGVAIAAALYSCASVGRIEGGPYDETPPRFISGTPTPGALHHNKNKLSIEFDEFIKLDKPNEKIVISPPQVQQPEIKSNGKKVVITLQDTLKSNTTYTFDFGDAIQDNNEGNPLENFFYSFSTGDRLDSMAVAGTVLNAANLEPVKECWSVCMPIWPTPLLPNFLLSGWGVRTVADASLSVEWLPASIAFMPCRMRPEFCLFPADGSDSF